MQPLRFIFHVFGPAETINCEPHGLVEGSRPHFDGMLNSASLNETRHRSKEVEAGEDAAGLAERYKID